MSRTQQFLFFRGGLRFGFSPSRGNADPYDESVQVAREIVSTSQLTATDFLFASLSCLKGLRASLSFAGSLVWYNEIPLLDRSVRSEPSFNSFRGRHACDRNVEHIRIGSRVTKWFLRSFLLLKLNLSSIQLNASSGFPTVHTRYPRSILGFYDTASCHHRSQESSSLS